MIAIIQCANSKSKNAGHFLTKEGKKIIFVADPARATKNSDEVYFHPDDASDEGISWRKKLVSYNKNFKRSRKNPSRLLPAVDLYKNKIYRRLSERMTTYVLSAGWGLIQGDYLIPYYDITFSDEARRRSPEKFRSGDDFKDFNHLPNESDEPVVFFGSKSYVPIFLELTSSYKGRRILFHKTPKTKLPLEATQKCCCKLFETRGSTNWHYKCAKSFLNEDHSGIIGFER